MKDSVKIFCLALIAAFTIQLAYVGIADAHNVNQRSYAKCDQRCQERYEACRDRGGDPSPPCYKRYDRCEKNCLATYPSDYSHDHD